MIRRYLFLIFFLLPALQAFPQMYILNEDFHAASGTTPPAGWTNIVISGGAGDSWHFDNPGDRTINYPVTDPFAIFDSDSTSANGQPEEVALETPLFDASTSNYILLYFAHTFYPGTGGSARIEAYDGDIWHVVVTFSSETSNPAIGLVDLSDIVGGLTNARLRFIWSGNGSGFWAIDNIGIYASLPLDGGVVSLDSPNSPVVPGVQNVEITLGNFGYNSITSAKIDWTADGIPQTQHAWNGSIGFGQTQSNIVIGTYDFQDPVMIKVWQSSPNGQPDLNPYNDTISKYLVAALCGTYTIGGNNPDFESFAQAADVLNTAGILCPVTFLVRNGTYLEKFELGDIQGTSAINTITFRSESGDSSQAVIKIIPGALKYEPMIYLNGSKHIFFQNLGFATGSTVSYANDAVLLNCAGPISLTGCYFEIRNQFDYGLRIQECSQDIEIRKSRFESISAQAGAIIISGAQTREIDIRENNFKGATEWGYATIRVGTMSGNVNITGNIMERCFRAIYMNAADSIRVIGNMINNSNDGIYVDEYCNNIEISANRLTNIKSHPNVQDGTSGILVRNSSATEICNNYIHTTGNGPVMGISLEEATSCRVCFNSVNITNDDTQGRSKGILMKQGNEVVARNNIFRVKTSGTPIYINDPVNQLDFDKNDYYCFDKTIGFAGGIRYTDLAAWAGAVNMDMNSMSVMPFYTSETDLSVNQALLNNAGVPVAGIAYDIDSTLRNPANPDIGAKEYNPCATDAGINSVINPDNPLNGGLEDIIVLLQNQGTNALVSVQINWSVNDLVQTPFPWSGNLAGGANASVLIGQYNFQPGILYTVKAWTSQPNNITDCNLVNDTISSQELAVPLCGSYTIGGSNPDFSTVKEAVTLLNLAGITCPVIFDIRDGIYREQLIINDIAGTSDVNTVTFRSESGDSTHAILQIITDALKFESMIYLAGSQYIIFRELGLFTGAALSYSNNAIVMESTGNILFEGCYFEVRKESDIGISILAGCQDITVEKNRFESFNPKAIAVGVEGEQTRGINILGNNIKGATEWGYATIRFENEVRAINITGNLIENCYRAIYLVNSDTALIRQNTIKNTNDGIFIDNWCSFIEISGNRLVDIKCHENAPEGTSGIMTFNVTQTSIFNNFIHTSGDGPVAGISLQNSSNCKVSFNSINITSNDVQGKSKGLNLKTSSAITARNNILNIMYSGTPVYISSTLPQIDFNYNDYYSTKQVIGLYNGQVFSDLVTWRVSTGMDQNSLDVTPFFTSETDLAINQVLLNNAGIPVAGITEDIDGILRDPGNPDIGAKEYNPCSTDAGINAILSPRNPLTGGTEEVKVVLQNQGTGVLTSAKINWAVNVDLQSPYSWTGNLAPAANAEVILGNYNFQPGGSYILKVWTSEPNNTTDCNHKNDTIKSRELAGPLCGTYTVGGSNPDFASFSQVAEVLNTAGITCPVTFLVRDGVYNEKFILREIAGSSTVNTITFRSENGDSTQAIIHIDPAAVNYEPMILLDKSHDINFEGLGLSTGTSVGIANYAIQMTGAKNIKFEGCYIESKNENDFGIDMQAGSQGVTIRLSRFECSNSKSGAINMAGAETQDINIIDNRITGAAAWGNTLVKAGNTTRKITLTGNYIDRSFRSVYFSGADSILIEGNIIKNTNSGIYIDNMCSDVEISRNRLINVQSYANLPEGTSGIFVQNSSGIDIVNNFVQSAGQGPVLGINLLNVDSCNTYYNSVNITNTDAQGKSKGIYLKASSSILARNNIFNIKSSGIPVYVDINVTELNLDYNNYFNPAGIIGKVNDVVYSNLFEWGQTINGDANSKAVNPYFKADTIPLPYQKNLNGAGIPVSGIIFDIDGKIRHFQAPDIGCIEFFIDYGILELLSPTLDCFHPDVDSVKVYIRQFGDVPFENLKVAYELVEVGTVHIDTIPGPLIYDIIHTFSTTESISVPGEYTFRVWLVGNTDDNINNDVLIAKRYSKPPPVVSIEYDNVCTGWEVHFTGNATVVDPYYIDKYEWFFGDGDTSTLQNPVHTYLEAGTYDVILRAYSNAGCYTEENIPVIVYPDFQGLRLNYNLVNETCAGDGTGSLEILGTGGNPPYSYFLNGEAVAGTLSNFSSGNYEIKVVDAQNCTRTDSLESYPLVNLAPQIFADPVSGYTPLTVQFNFTANGAESWTWHFTETDTGNDASPSFTFLEYGYHKVILEVRSGPPYNCTDTASIEIFVDIIITIEANNVFTPNDDGYNDFFEIKSVGLKEMNVNIFNQWGNKMYEIDEVDGKWDGYTKSGAKAPDGTYFWALKATGVDEKEYDRQGSVLLLRHGSAAYPNPVTDNVRIKTYDLLNSPVIISVYSVFGQLAHSETVIDPENIVIDISHLSGGIYILKVSDGNLDSYVRIIKN